MLHGIVEENIKITPLLHMTGIIIQKDKFIAIYHDWTWSLSYNKIIESVFWYTQMYSPFLASQLNQQL